MANKRISELSPLGGSVASDDVVPMTRGSASYKLSLAQIRTFVEQTGSGEYESLEDLQAATPANGAMYFTRCHTTLGDGGGGVWRGATGSPGTYTNNGTTVVLPTGGDGSAAFLREDVTCLRPEMAGAKGDNATNDAAALAAIFALGSALRLPVEISKPHVVTTGINISNLDNLTIRGLPNGQIRMTGTNKTIIFGGGCDNLRIRDLTLIGNNTGLGIGGNAQEEGGSGIHLSGAKEAKIDDCVFKNFGAPGDDPVSGSSGVFFYRCFGGRIFRNFADGSNDGISTSAFAAGGCSGTVISHNESRGNDDGSGGFNIDVNVNGDFSAATTVARCVVSNNHFWRAPGTASRHGILTAYYGFPMSVVISSNVIEGFNWTGIYAQLDVEDLGGVLSGAFVISNNIIRYCAGGSSNSLSAAIWLGSVAGAVISGNLIHRPGYDSDEEARDYAVCPGIYVGARAADVNVMSNTILRGRGRGILVGGSAADLMMQRVRIGGNIVTECLGDHIMVWAAATSALNCVDIAIDYNQIHTGAANAAAISLRSENGGTYDRISVRGNSCVSTCVQGTDTLAVGLWLGLNEHEGLISGNTFRGFDAAVDAPGSQRSLKPTFTENIITNCRYSVRHRTNTAMVGYGFVPRGSISNPTTSGVRQAGRPLAYYSSTEIPMEWRGDALITGAYVNGDQAWLGRNQHQDYAGMLYIETANPSTPVPIYWDVPNGPWTENYAIADAGTLVSTVSTSLGSASRAFKVVWHYMCQLVDSSWYAGEFTAYYIRGASGNASLVSSGHVGPAAATGWTFTPSLSETNGSPRLTLTNGTGETRGARLEATLRVQNTGTI